MGCSYTHVFKMCWSRKTGLPCVWMAAMSGWRAADFRLEGECGPFMKGNPAENKGYFYEFFHKYVRFVRSKAFFWARFGVDRKTAAELPGRGDRSWLAFPRPHRRPAHSLSRMESQFKQPRAGGIDSLLLVPGQGYGAGLRRQGVRVVSRRIGGRLLTQVKRSYERRTSV